MKNFDTLTKTLESPTNPADSVMTAEEYSGIKHETPYTFQVSGNGTELMYFGARHSRSAEDTMFQDIQSKFDTFEPDIVLVEGMTDLEKQKDQIVGWLRTQSNKDVIDKMGESGFVLKLAAEKNIDFISPEPDSQEEAQALLEQGFGKDEIFAYYFYRIIPQWHLQEDKPAAKEYLEGHLKRLAIDIGWSDYDFSFDHAVAIGKELWGEDLNLEDEHFYGEKTDPIPWAEQKETQGAVNLVSRACSFYRDQYMVGKIA